MLVVLNFPVWWLEFGCRCLSSSMSLSQLIKHHKLWCISLYVMVALFPGKKKVKSVLCCWLLIWNTPVARAMPAGLRSSVGAASWWGTMSLMKVLLRRATSVMFTSNQGAEWENFSKKKKKEKRNILEMTSDDYSSQLFPIWQDGAIFSGMCYHLVFLVSFSHSLSLRLMMPTVWRNEWDNHSEKEKRKRQCQRERDKKSVSWSGFLLLPENSSHNTSHLLVNSPDYYAVGGQRTWRPDQIEASFHYTSTCRSCFFPSRAVACGRNGAPVWPAAGPHELTSHKSSLHLLLLSSPEAVDYWRWPLVSGSIKESFGARECHHCNNAFPFLREDVKILYLLVPRSPHHFCSCFLLFFSDLLSSLHLQMCSTVNLQKLSVVCLFALFLNYVCSWARWRLARVVW